MPRTGWLSSHTSGTHLPSLLHHGSSSAPNPANIPIPPTPGGVSFSSGVFDGDHLPSTPGFGPLQTPGGFGGGGASYFPSASGTTTPASEFGSYGGSVGTPAHLGPTTPGGSHSWVEIVLDQEHVVLRGAGGDTNPAQLSGRVLLHLVESTSLKEVTLSLTGKAKVSFGEGAGCVSAAFLLVRVRALAGRS